MSSVLKGRTEGEGQKTEDDRKNPMTFTVTYRAKDGALGEETVEAADRAACVAACRTRGIAPVSVREGRASARPRSGKRAASPSGRTGGTRFRVSVWRAAILAAAVLVVGVGVWWWLGSRGAASLPTATPERPKVEKPERPATKPATKPVAPSPVAKPAPRPAPFRAKTKPVKTAEVEPPEIAQARILEHYSAINPQLVRDHELFKHDSDIMIADVITARPGVFSQSPIRENSCFW